METRQVAPQAISALLGRAGFRRSQYTPRSRTQGGRHPYGDRTAGYLVRKDWASSASVRVEHFVPSHGPTRNQQVMMLGKYAQVIVAAGYHVEADENRLLLVVTALSTR